MPKSVASIELAHSERRHVGVGWHALNQGPNTRGHGSSLKRLSLGKGGRGVGKAYFGKAASCGAKRGQHPVQVARWTECMCSFTQRSVCGSWLCVRNTRVEYEFLKF